MKKLKFKGKTIGGEWVIGNLSILSKKYEDIEAGYYISNSAGVPFAFHVRPEIICMNTGLYSFSSVFIKTSNKEAFEHDIIRFFDTDGKELIKEISYNEALCCFMVGNVPYSQLRESGYIQPSELEFKIIGNIFDDPDLLKR
jgi:hypothetical protein